MYYIILYYQELLILSIKYNRFFIFFVFNALFYLQILFFYDKI